MMPPVQGKAWFCPRCGVPYRHLESAGACCICTECGGRNSYPGHNRICERCGLRRTIEHNVQHQVDLEETLKTQRQRLAILDAAAQATPEVRKIVAALDKAFRKSKKKRKK
jgi:hypothetical protein